jgi:hypothetical protein
VPERWQAAKSEDSRAGGDSFPHLPFWIRSALAEEKAFDRKRRKERAAKDAKKNKIKNRTLHLQEAV